jgi:hypothetical protein
MQVKNIPCVEYSTVHRHHALIFLGSILVVAKQKPLPLYPTPEKT